MFCQTVLLVARSRASSCYHLQVFDQLIYLIKRLIKFMYDATVEGCRELMAYCMSEPRTH